MRSLALICLSAAAASAAPTIRRVAIVGRVGDGAWSDAPALEVRRDQKFELAAIVVVQRGKRTVVLAPAGVDRVKLGAHAIDTAPLEHATVRWRAIEPHGFRTSKATNGATSEFYSNVSTEPRTFGHWLGFDHIDYAERELAAKTAIITPAIDSPDVQLPGIGTLRFAVEVELDGARAASPGLEARDTFGISASVYRVSVRQADDFLGWLSSYMLVPEVFGSAGGGRDHQTERFTGADCADVMVGAMRRAGRTDLAYSNVAGLPAMTTLVAGSTELDGKGMPAQPIIGVKRGDLIRIDYGGTLAHHTPRDWDHVAALWEDKSDPKGPQHGGPDGKLDGFDLVIHMGHPRLVIEPLAQQAPATIDVLRWRTR